MEISDDGRGFDDEIKGTGYGLQNMCTRIKEIGGEISICGEKYNGTKIKLQLPFPFKIPNSWDRKNNFR
jgi:signal transduction histidine kinase